MSHSLRDKLLGLGFTASAKPEPKPARPPDKRRDNQAAKRKAGAHAHGKARHGDKPGTAPNAARNTEEIDLARAYAIRAQKEKNDRLAAERAQQEQARLRREAKAKLAELFKDNVLNDPAAELARHFEYGGKIKRIYVTADQLKALNAGELGVVQANGRYLLVSAQTLNRAEAIFPAAIALRVDPDAPASAEPYADPQFQVPDDLVW
ncbi:MAG: DUF2058 family protein [Xanthomonadaceae bacterium]|nr:DUF2058 family protein [Xanthomonadaceae bacterium]MDP2183964.1 DUF2058 family protein [Xanthomonadales bacterium]MDZ4116531.1 DUF2058 family protein [Xanthomonadaceae bacterium]MDZ4376926.1 DUF2058 family protein [Xanthomonadaceae bacterium]